MIRTLLAGMLVLLMAPSLSAQEKPNILFIMTDDVGLLNIGAYHRGLMSSKTPNLDKIAREGALYTDYYAEPTCTAGRSATITGQFPVRTGMHSALSHRFCSSRSSKVRARMESMRPQGACQIRRVRFLRFMLATIGWW